MYYLAFCYNYLSQMGLSSHIPFLIVGAFWAFAFIIVLMSHFIGNEEEEGLTVKLVVKF